MYVIDLRLPPASVDALEDEDEWFDYQPGEFSLAETDGTPAGVGPLLGAGRGRRAAQGQRLVSPADRQVGLQVKFPADELFYGLRVLTLNNMVEDPSMIHETLAYTAYRGAGVPGSRTGYAYVYVNGEDYGVHLNIETMDRIALEKRFGAFDEETQHLYEGEGGADAWLDFEWSFEIDEGEDDRSDLEALSAAVNSEGPPDWPTRVASVIDLDEMTRMWAVEKYIGQWDGYAGLETEWTPNNYYLYSDASGKFKMLPWGNDETWQEAYHLAFDGRAGRMFDRCLDDAACLEIYRDSVAAVREAIAGMDLDALALQSATLLGPWQALEEAQSTREEHRCPKIQAGVAETRTFIATRDADAAEWLEEPAPQPASEVALKPCGVTDSDGSVALPAAARQGGAPARLTGGRAWAAKGILRARLALPSSGRAILRATIQVEGKRVTVCSGERSVKRARALTLRCRLTEIVGQRRRAKWLRLAVTTGFRPSVGAPESTSHWVLLPRAAPV